MHLSYRRPKRTAALVFFGIMMLILAACGQPQPQSKSPTIGIITMGNNDAMLAQFKQTLAELGHVEGQNVTYVYDGSLQNLADVEPAVRRLRDAKVDLVFAFATPPAKAAQKVFADTDIPIVFLLHHECGRSVIAGHTHIRPSPREPERTRDFPLRGGTQGRGF